MGCCPFFKHFRVSHRRGGDLSFLNVGVPSCSRLAVGTYFEVLGWACLREYGAAAERRKRRTQSGWE